MTQNFEHKIGTRATTILKTLGALFIISCILGPGVSYGGLYLAHMVIFVAIAYILLVRDYRLQIFEILSKRLNIVLIMCFIWLLISILWAENKSYGITSLIHFGIGLSVVFLTQFFLKDIQCRSAYYKKLLPSLFLIVAVISGLEIFTDFRWPISTFSEINHYFGRENVIEKILSTQVIPGYVESSPTAFFWNTNHLAVFICFFLPFIMKNNWKSYLMFVAAILIIVSTGSRLTTISVGFVLLVLPLMKLSKIRFFGLFLLTLLSTIAISPNSIMSIKADEPLQKVTGIYFIGLFDFINEQNDLPINKEPVKKEPVKKEPVKKELVKKEPDNSQGIRSVLYKQGINYLLNSKFLGIGSGNAEWYNYKNKANTQNVTSVHFYWLELAINGGAVLVLLMSYFFINLLKSLWLTRKNTFNEDLFISLFLFGIAVIALSSAHYFLSYYLFLGIVLSQIYNNQNHEKSTTIS